MEIGALPEEVRRRPPLGPLGGRGRGLGAPEKCGGRQPHSDQGHLVCASSLPSPPQAEDFERRLGPRNRGCRRCSDGCAWCTHIPPSTCAQVAWKPLPRAHLAHTRKLRAGARRTYQSHTHTMSPSHLPYSGSQVFSYKTFPGPTFQPSHPKRWGKGCEEGRTKAMPFLDGGSLCAVLSSYLGCLTNPATCMSPHTLSWGARRGGPWRPPRKNEGIQEGPGFPGGR